MVFGGRVDAAQREERNRDVSIECVSDFHGDEVLEVRFGDVVLTLPNSSFAVLL
jgi:hypothetical protein